MITRIWHGWTKPENATAYEDLLRNEVFPSIASRGGDGFLRARLLRRDLDDEVEFVTILSFDSLEAIRSFAGDDYEVAVVPAPARDLLTRFEERSRHYTTALGFQPSSGVGS